jgi:hypothetical protein
VAGALSVIRYAKAHGSKHRPWLTALLARRPAKVAAIALANKLARMAWAMMARGERYRNPVALFYNHRSLLAQETAALRDFHPGHDRSGSWSCENEI